MFLYMFYVKLFISYNLNILMKCYRYKRNIDIISNKNIALDYIAYIL